MSVVGTSEPLPVVPPEPLPVVRPRRRWLRVLLVLVVFGSGFVVGGGTALLAVKQRLSRAISHPEEEAARRARTLARDLGLSADQRAQVESILARRLTRLRDGVREQLRHTGREVNDVLTPEQKTRWQSMLKQIERRNRSPGATLPAGDSGF